MKWTDASRAFIITQQYAQMKSHFSTIYSNFQVPVTSSSLYNASYSQNEYFHFYYAIEHSSYTFLLSIQYFTIFICISISFPAAPQKRSTLRSTTRNNSTVPWNKFFSSSSKSNPREKGIDLNLTSPENCKFQRIDSNVRIKIENSSGEIFEAPRPLNEFSSFFTQCFWVMKKFHKGSLIKGESFVRQRIFASKCAAIYLFGS